MRVYPSYAGNGNSVADTNGVHSLFRSQKKITEHQPGY